LKKKIILASNSPRRKELLKSAGVEFEVIVSDINEDVHICDDPKRMVLDLAKANSLVYVEDESGHVESFDHAFYLQSYYREEWIEAFKECGFEVTDEMDDGGYHSFEVVKAKKIGI